MIFDIADAADEVAVPLGKVASEQVLHQTLKLGVEALRVSRLRVNDLLVNIHGIVVHEGSVTGVHLID